MGISKMTQKQDVHFKTNHEKQATPPTQSCNRHDKMGKNRYSCTENTDVQGSEKRIDTH